MTLRSVHGQIDDHGGTTGAVLCWAAARHRDHRPVRVNSVREQERRLTGAGARNLMQSVPVSSPIHRSRGLILHARRRRAVAILLPGQLVATSSHDHSHAGRCGGRWRVEPRGSAPRSLIQFAHQPRRQALADVMKRHSIVAFRGRVFDDPNSTTRGFPSARTVFRGA